MALNKSGLKNSLKQIYLDNIDKHPEPDEESKAQAEEEAEKMAEKMANAIEAFVKSGTVTFSTGEVTGACPPEGGPLSAGAATGGEIS